MHPHATAIKQLGGGSAVAALLSRVTGRPVDRERVYKWQENGVASEFRIALARVCLGHDVAIPDGLLPEGVDASALTPVTPDTESA